MAMPTTTLTVALLVLALACGVTRVATPEPRPPMPTPHPTAPRTPDIGVTVTVLPEVRVLPIDIPTPTPILRLTPTPESSRDPLSRQELSEQITPTPTREPQSIPQSVRQAPLPATSTPVPTPTRVPTATRAPMSTLTSTPTLTHWPTPIPNPLTKYLVPNPTTNGEKFLVKAGSVDWFADGCVNDTLPDIGPGYFSRHIPGKGTLEGAPGHYIADPFPDDEFTIVSKHMGIHLSPATPVLRPDREGHLHKEWKYPFSANCVIVIGDVEARLTCYSGVDACTNDVTIDPQPGNNFVLVHEEIGVVEGGYWASFRRLGGKKECGKAAVYAIRLADPSNKDIWSRE